MKPVVIKQEAELQQTCVFVDSSAPLWQRQMAFNSLKSEPTLLKQLRHAPSPLQSDVNYFVHLQM
jgi:hypothetical protein